MPDGFFSIEYVGATGSGIGLMALKGGKIAGVDASGGRYSGDYQESNAFFEGALHLDVPAGHQLVTGYSQPTDYRITIPLRLPLDLGNGKPLRVQTNTGPVTVAVRWLAPIPF
jgi:hypothetical protein